MPDKTPRVTTSAGHGMSSRVAGSVDPGAEFINDPRTEAGVVLDLARNLHADYEVLFANLPGAASFLLNTGRYDRADDYAVLHVCDKFNELHTDAAKKSYKPDGHKMGTSVLYEDPADAAYAAAMSAAVAKAAGVPDRGVKRRTDLAVLTPHPKMHQFIIEVLFGTDADDVLAYKAHETDIEIAILNVNLANWGMRLIKSKVPPRKWNAADRLYYRTRRFS